MINNCKYIYNAGLSHVEIVYCPVDVDKIFVNIFVESVILPADKVFKTVIHKRLKG